MVTQEDSDKKLKAQIIFDNGDVLLLTPSQTLTSKYQLQYIVLNGGKTKLSQAAEATYDEISKLGITDKAPKWSTAKFNLEDSSDDKHAFTCQFRNPSWKAVFWLGMQAKIEALPKLPWAILKNTTNTKQVLLDQCDFSKGQQLEEVDFDQQSQVKQAKNTVPIKAEYKLPGKNHIVFTLQDKKIVYDFDATNCVIEVFKADGTMWPPNPKQTYTPYEILKEDMHEADGETVQLK
eukprot:GHVT01062119.1.p1 GENE.GHVT01062119.1~~GHVT01062119.1.p1  ORF type:complete len:235 (-),score=20.56 GHVT01062119.1:1610-2314(-)